MLKDIAASKLGAEARDLITRLMCGVNDRLGSHGVDEIKSHPFFRGIDWQNLYSHQAAYQPVVEHELDTNNFEKFEEDENFSAFGGPGAGGDSRGSQISARHPPDIRTTSARHDL